MALTSCLLKLRAPCSWILGVMPLHRERKTVPYHQSTVVSRARAWFQPSHLHRVSSSNDKWKLCPAQFLVFYWWCCAEKSLNASWGGSIIMSTTVETALTTSCVHPCSGMWLRFVCVWLWNTQVHLFSRKIERLELTYVVAAESKFLLFCTSRRFWNFEKTGFQPHHAMLLDTLSKEKLAALAHQREKTCLAH